MRPRSLGIALCCSCGLLALVASRPGVSAQAPRTVVDVSASHHILLLLSDGSVWGAVDNRFGQLGREPSDERVAPLRRIGLPEKAVQVAASGATSFALLEDGTVWAWGRGDSGQLGATLPPGAARATPEAIPGLTRVRTLTSGPMALLADGTVRAWGPVSRTFTGTDSSIAPQPVVVTGLTDVNEIAGTTGLGVAVTRSGRAIAWDLLDHPYLLPGGREIAPAPPAEVAELRDVVSAAVMDLTTAVVTRDGSVWTWGQNSQGGLGNGTTASGPGTPPQFAPGRVAGVVGAVSVKGSGRHYLVLRKDRTLIGWGNSDWGQLGAGVTGRFQTTPTPIKLANVEAYWPGGNYSFARTADGSFWFWGERDGAAALLGTNRNYALPAKVALEAILTDP